MFHTAKRKEVTGLPAACLVMAFMMATLACALRFLDFYQYLRNLVLNLCYFQQ